MALLSWTAAPSSTASICLHPSPEFVQYKATQRSLETKEGAIALYSKDGKDKGLHHTFEFISLQMTFTALTVYTSVDLIYQNTG